MDLKDTLLGFFGRRSSIGAAQPGTGPAPGKPVSPSKYPKGKKTKGIETHGKVLKAGRKTLGHAQAVLKKAAQALAKAPLHPVPKAATHVGVAAKVAQAKHAAAVARANEASKTLANRMLNARQSMKNLSRAMVAQKKLAVSMRRPKGRIGRSAIGLAEFIGEHELVQAEVEEMIGATGLPEFIGQDPANPPDPSNPGFLMDGSPDPSAGGAGGGLSDGSLGDAIDNGDVSFPAPPDMSVAYPDMTKVGGIAYDGSKGYPDGFVGSLGLFTRATDRHIEPMSSDIDGNEHHGYMFGQYDWKDPRLSGFGRDSGGSNKQPGGGVPWGSSLRSGTWNWVHGRHWLGSEDWHTDVVDPTAMFGSPFLPGTPGDAAHAANMAYGQSFGPLVGNPAMKDFQSMRVDAAGNMYWLPQDAPDWLTFPLKQAAALTAKAAQDAQAAADAANRAAIAKISADAAVAKAQQDAQQASAESAAASASTVQQSQAEGQAAQVLAQQGQADLEAQQLETEQARQAGQILLDQARQQAAAPDQGAVDEGAPSGLGPEDMTPAEMEEQGVTPDEGPAAGDELTPEELAEQQDAADLQAEGP